LRALTLAQLENILGIAGFISKARDGEQAKAKANEI
jgi:hypothetical protein